MSSLFVLYLIYKDSYVKTTIFVHPTCCFSYNRLSSVFDSKSSINSKLIFLFIESGKAECYGVISEKYILK